jgi:uncharacterized protein (DUF2336 family)
MDQTASSIDGRAEPGLDPREALDLLNIRARRDSTELARRTDAGPDVLTYLATHGAPATRKAVAANPATPAATNRLLAEDDQADVRAELAAKIARLMPGLRAQESAHIQTLTLETLEQLARDTMVRVRAVLAEAIKTLDCIPHSVVMTLARDADSIVSAPILEYSPLLSSTDLMEIIAYGQVSEALAAIARRKGIDADVSAALVQTLDVSAVADLLVNPSAAVRKETMDRIINQAGEIAAWQEPLTLRADLSARAIRRIAGLVGSSIIERLAARHDLSEATRVHLNRELRARLAEERGILEGEDETESSTQTVATAQAEGRLGDRFVEQAAMAGRRDVVVQALAVMARVNAATVRKILASGHARAVVALVWHAHLSMRVAFKIQATLLKLPAPDILPARDGIAFPLTREEMRWHLSYFDIVV